MAKEKRLFDAETQKKIDWLNGQIAFLERRASVDRFDREELAETDALIANYERQLEELLKAATAKKASKVTSKKKTAFSKRAPVEIASLQHEYDILDERTDKLAELMFACELNMDTSERSADVSEQAARDLDYYRKEYESSMSRMRQIGESIKNHRR